MIVCPNCGDHQREGTGVCFSCEYRFPPGTDEISEVRPLPKPRSSKPVKRISGLAIGALLVGFAVLSHANAPVPTAQAGLNVFVSQISSTIEKSGQLDATTEQSLVQAARTTTGCGDIQPYVIPVASITGGQQVTPGMASPLSQVMTYVKTTFHAQYVAGTTALKGTVIVAAGAWGCP